MVEALPLPRLGAVQMDYPRGGASLRPQDVVVDLTTPDATVDVYRIEHLPLRTQPTHREIPLDGSGPGNHLVRPRPGCVGREGDHAGIVSKSSLTLRQYGRNVRDVPEMKDSDG